MRALVVDDSKAIRGILKRLLTELGFDVMEAGNGKEALDLLQKGVIPDVALVDWNMPEMDGVAFIREVRKDATRDGLRLMVITTEMEIGRVAEALDAGAQEYILKPLTKETLRAKLTALGL
jgi:two-component system chemotaxis response regulator CheY